MLPVALNSRNSVQGCINSLVLKMLNGTTRNAVKIEKVVRKKKRKITFVKKCSYESYIYLKNVDCGKEISN